MKLDIRELTNDDLPKIKWLQRDLQISPDVSEEGRVWIADDTCSFFGALLDGKFVGVVNLRKKSPKLAWIEGIRVHHKYQKIGIGSTITGFLLDLVSERNFSRVAYATQADNLGSYRLAEKFGFQIDGEMDVAYSKLEWFDIEKLDTGDKYRVSLENGTRHLSKIPNGPPKEICIGWNFAPKTTSYFEPFGEDIQFYIKGDTILLQYHERSPLTNEINFVKSIVYGNSENIPELLNGFIRRSEKFKDKILICLSHKNLTDVVCSNGWTRGLRPTTIVLFAKDI